MKKDFMRQTVCPIIAALLWGTAFVAQSVGADLVDAFTFTAIRSFIGSLALIPVVLILRKTQKYDEAMSFRNRQYVKKLLIGGLSCGTVLFAATYFQQLGLSYTSPGKAGFITALYIVLVPIFGIVVKRKAPVVVWVSVVIAVIGLYFLCIKEDFSINVSDVYVLICSVLFSIHILLIDHFTQFIDGVELSCTQFFTAGILSTVAMFLFETPNISDILACWFPIVYVGIFSSGVAYTLQIVAQKGSNPTVVSLLLSLESVFATISGAIILGDIMSVKEYVGCGLMLIAVILAQLPDSVFRKKVKA